MTKSFHCFHMEIKGGLHLGSGMDVYERSSDLWQSDAIKSALYATLVKWLGYDAPNAQDFLKAFKISSAFPYQNSTLYFPIPRFSNLNWHQVNESEKLKYRKKRKKLEWIEYALFEQLINGQSLSIHENQVIAGKFIHAKSVAENAQIPYADELMERVTISRIPSEDHNSTPFYFRRIHFQKNGGLFFLLEAEDEQWIQRYFYPALRLLGDEGIGSDRSSGGAYFHFDSNKHHTQINLRVPAETRFWFGLGNYLPTEESWKLIDDQKSNWFWEKRGGYVSSPANPQALNLRKQNVYMLKTACILHTPSPPQGQLINLAPNTMRLSAEKANALNHPVWRDGAPLFLPYLPAQHPHLD